MNQQCEEPWARVINLLTKPVERSVRAQVARTDAVIGCLVAMSAAGMKRRELVELMRRESARLEGVVPAEGSDLLSSLIDNLEGNTVPEGWIRLDGEPEGDAFYEYVVNRG